MALTDVFVSSTFYEPLPRSTLRPVAFVIVVVVSNICFLFECADL